MGSIQNMPEVGCAAARKTLTAKFPGQITLPGDPEYEAETNLPWLVPCPSPIVIVSVCVDHEYYRCKTCWFPAACYVRPANAEEVAASLKIIVTSDSKFSIRCTGHSHNPGFSSVDDSGVVLDLRELKSLSVDDNGLLRAGAGATWGEIYTFLQERELSVIGARHPGVGVSGYLLGGTSWSELESASD
jgi:hypothetical protein